MKYLVILLNRANNIVEVSNLPFQLRRYRKMNDVEMDDLVDTKVLLKVH